MLTQNIDFGNYYVYVHIRLDNNEIFYVGKGTKDRIKSTKNRNKYWHNIVKKVGYRYEKIEENISDEASKELEIFIISEIGRNKLCNMTNGGDGSIGCTPSIETRRKLSIALTNRVLSEESRRKISESKLGIKKSREEIARRSLKRTGMKMSDEIKLKMSKARKGVLKSEEHKKAMSIHSGRARKIVCVELDMVFNSSSEAAIYLGSINKRKCINDAVLGRQKIAYSYTWKHL